MEFMLAVVGLGLLGMIVLGFVLAVSQVGTVRRLARRVELLENEVRRLRTRPATAPAETIDADVPWLTPEVTPAPVPPPAVAPHAPTPSAARPPAPPPRPAPAPHDAIDLARVEQLVGGVWLQNLGAVLLLVGVFLMILWGYTTGRFGPQVLVAAGELLGVAFVWRGDRVARRLATFGHALIGIGLGIVYLTLYLGFARLHVLPPAAALVLLALVSVASIVAALRYRVQLIGALGVIGAFLPQFLAAWLDLGGFRLSPWMLFAYLATIDVVVFALAARAGWSALDLAALVLSACAWRAAFPGIHWGWGQQLALSALFTLLGVAPLPRLVAVSGRVRAIDLAVVALAPLALLVATAPFLAWASRETAAGLLFALAAALLGAAWWTDQRRPERDLWAPLTGAAALFVAVGLERAFGTDVTPFAWCVEGVLLIALGLAPRAGALRVWGSLVLFAGAVTTLQAMADTRWTPDQLPLVHPAALRALGSIASVLVASALLARARERLRGSLDRWSAETWGAIGHALLLGWIGAESGRVATWWYAPAHGHPLPTVSVSLHDRRESLAAALRSAAWAAQAGVLAWLGARAGRAFPRLAALVVGAVSVVGMLFWLGVDGWWLDQWPVLHVASLLQLAVVAIAFAVAANLAAMRARLAPWESRTPELWAGAAAFALALWGVREADHLARAIVGPGAMGDRTFAPPDLRRFNTLRAACWSGLWLLEAVGLLVAGWLRGSAFLRWTALGLLAITLLKFIAIDLQTVDVFWRFLTAIVVGAAMLAMSYAYQRRVRGREPSSTGVRPD